MKEHLILEGEKESIYYLMFLRVQQKGHYHTQYNNISSYNQQPVSLAAPVMLTD